MNDFLDDAKVKKLKDEIDHVDRGLVIVIGNGASLIHPGDILVYADLARWEAQLRMRRYPLAGIAHMLIFFGFLVLLLRTLILWGRGVRSVFQPLHPRP